MADSEGFEPSIPDKGYASLAGRWFQPAHPTVLSGSRVLQTHGFPVNAKNGTFKNYFLSTLKSVLSSSLL